MSAEDFKTIRDYFERIGWCLSAPQPGPAAAALERLEAQAAVMCEALGVWREWYSGIQKLMPDEMQDRIRAALASDAGSALLERHAADLRHAQGAVALATSRAEKAEAERDALRTEVRIVESLESLTKDRDALRAEVEQLRAEVQKVTTERDNHLSIRRTEEALAQARREERERLSKEMFRQGCPECANAILDFKGD